MKLKHNGHNTEINELNNLPKTKILLKFNICIYWIRQKNNRNILIACAYYTSSRHPLYSNDTRRLKLTLAGSTAAFANEQNKKIIINHIPFELKLIHFFFIHFVRFYFSRNTTPNWTHTNRIYKKKKNNIIQIERNITSGQ